MSATVPYQSRELLGAVESVLAADPAQGGKLCSSHVYLHAVRDAILRGHEITIEEALQVLCSAIDYKNAALVNASLNAVPPVYVTPEGAFTYDGPTDTVLFHKPMDKP